MRARLLSLFAVLLAFAAVGGAFGASRLCRAEVERRACHCDHAADVVDDCCTRQDDDGAAPAAFALLVPEAVAPRPVLRLRPPVAEARPIPAMARKEAARAPPSVPRFLAIRTLLI